MGFEQKHNFFASFFIVLLIVVVWLVADWLFGSNNQQSAKPIVSKTIKKEQNYIEKINNAVLQTFDKNQQIVFLIKAKTYLNFKHSAPLLLLPKFTSFDETGKINYTIDANRANLFAQRIKLAGSVNINSRTGTKHKINTEELSINTKTHHLNSNKPIEYWGETAKIKAQGMRMSAKNDKIKLLGKTIISFDNGQKITTKELIINQGNNKKRYQSKFHTIYSSEKNKIFAAGVDLNMHKKTMKMLGKILILQKPNIKINTKNLHINQADNKEIYQTKDGVHYQSPIADIRADSMNFDGKNQKIKLRGGVIGRYE